MRFKMQKQFAEILCLALCICLLSGCSSPAPQRSATVESTAAAADYRAQIRLLANSQSQWQQEEAQGSVYHYAVTDLDRNGRLEILAMSTQGTGVYTYGNIFEVSEDGSSLLECSLPFEAGDLPEMIMDVVPAAFDSADGTYYYLFRDTHKNGAAEYYESIQAISLKDGAVSTKTLGRMSLVAVDGVAKEEYYCGDQSITQAEYEAIIPEFQSGLEGFTADLGWLTLEAGMDEAALTKSWEAFEASRN